MGRSNAVSPPRIEQPFTASQACTIGYFAKISSARLNALSAAVCGATPSFMISTQPALQTCSAALAAPCDLVYLDLGGTVVELIAY